VHSTSSDSRLLPTILREPEGNWCQWWNCQCAGNAEAMLQLFEKPSCEASGCVVQKPRQHCHCWVWIGDVIATTLLEVHPYSFVQPRLFHELTELLTRQDIPSMLTLPICFGTEYCSFILQENNIHYNSISDPWWTKAFWWKRQGQWEMEIWLVRLLSGRAWFLRRRITQAVLFAVLILSVRSLTGSFSCAQLLLHV
jgi:hypothetical protein